MRYFQTRGASMKDRKKHPVPKNLAGNIPKGHYVFDKKLVPRIQEYINQNRRKNIDVNEMADFLQYKYGEYGRKKKNAFRLSVEKVYKSICHQREEDKHLQHLEDNYLQKQSKSPDFRDLGGGSDDGSDDEVLLSDSSDSELELEDELLMEVKHSNSMNQSMQQMYRAGSKTVSEDEQGKTDEACSSTHQLPEPEEMTTQNCSSSSTLVQNHNPVQTSSTPLQNNKPVEKILDVTDSTPITKKLLSNTPLKRKQNSVSSSQLPETGEEKTPKKRSKSERKSLLKSQEKKNDQEIPEMQKGPVPVKSSVKFSSVGGCESCIEEVCKLLIHMRHPEVFNTLGVIPPRGFLLHGPPGCGKTLLANAIAGELDLPFIKLAATEIVSGVSGESEEKVRELFARAISHSPCVMFIDEIDAITPKRETASKDMERRIVAQLLACMDELNSNPEARVLVIGATNRPDSLDPALRRAGRFDREIKMGIPDEKSRQRILEVLCHSLKLSEGFSFSFLAKQTPGYVGADLMSLTREAAMCAVSRIFKNLENKARESNTTSIEPKDTESVLAVNPTLQTNQDQGIPMDISNSENKQENVPVSENVLIPESENVLIPENLQVTEDNSVNSLAFSVLDWLRDQPPLSEEQLQEICVSMQDFECALKIVQPSAQREGFATIPDVTWSDVGALEDIREELSMAILAPVRHPEEFSAFGLTNPPGILLAGPPGCGKTLLAKAVANESGINFISVKGPELLNMYVGESERAVRQVFQRARNSAPCVIFFDELDALCPRRSDTGESGASVRVVNQLLTEMDGLEARKQVFIMAATNRPDIIDPAVMRPGRLDKILYVGLPLLPDRVAILKTITKNGSKPTLLPDVDFEQVATKCEGYSGADLSALVREASVIALKECVQLSFGAQASSSVEQSDTIREEGKTKIIGVGMKHFDLAFDKIVPSVSEKDKKSYLKMKQQRERK